MYQNLHNVRHNFDALVSESLINPNPIAASAGAVRGPIIGAFDRLGTGEQGAYNRQDQDVYIGNADFQFAGQRLSYVGAYTKQDNGILAPQDTANYFSAPRVPIARRPGLTPAPGGAVPPLAAFERPSTPLRSSSSPRGTSWSMP